MRQLLPLLFLAALLHSSCQSSGAAEGATRGAVFGAISSGIVAGVFGGDVGRSAAHGAVGGAVVGGLSGAAADGRASDRERQQQLAAENAELERQNRELQLRQELIGRIGVDNTEAIAELVNCRHEEALVRLRRAKTAGNPDHDLAALWIEAALALDRRDTTAARQLYPTLVVRDAEVDSEADVEARALDLVSKLEDLRAEYGRPRRCE